MQTLIIIVAWLFALGCFVYLAVETSRNRVHVRHYKSAIDQRFREFKKHHHYDEKHQKWVRKADGSIVRGRANWPRGRMIFGIVILLLWELYWGSEVSRAESFSQIPYFFLFIVMVAIPYAVYLIARPRLE
jgi:hypothetical protein